MIITEELIDKETKSERVGEQISFTIEVNETPIEKEKLNLILEAGRIAPPACNNQPQKVYVAKSEEARKKLASVCRCTFDAPVILVIGYELAKTSFFKILRPASTEFTLIPSRVRKESQSSPNSPPEKA